MSKHIRNPARIQHLVKIGVPAHNLTLARLDDKPVDVLLQKLLQTFCPHAAGIPRIFQEDAVAVFGQHPVDPPMTRGKI